MKRINPYKLFVGCFVPNWLAVRKEISQGAKLCYARLAQYAGEKGYAYPFQETIAKEIGVSSRQVRRYLDELITHHVIDEEQQGLSSPNIYYFLENPWMELDQVIEFKGPDINVRSGPDGNVRSERTYMSGLSGHKRPTEENHLRESYEEKKDVRSQNEKTTETEDRNRDTPHSVPIEEVHKLVAGFLGKHTLEPPRRNSRIVHANADGEIEDEDRLAAARARKAAQLNKARRQGLLT